MSQYVNRVLPVFMVFEVVSLHFLSCKINLSGMLVFSDLVQFLGKTAARAATGFVLNVPKFLELCSSKADLRFLNWFN